MDVDDEDKDVDGSPSSSSLLSGMIFSSAAITSSRIGPLNGLMCCFPSSDALALLDRKGLDGVDPSEGIGLEEGGVCCCCCSGSFLVEATGVKEDPTTLGERKPRFAEGPETEMEKGESKSLSSFLEATRSFPWRGKCDVGMGRGGEIVRSLGPFGEGGRGGGDWELKRVDGDGGRAGGGPEKVSDLWRGDGSGEVKGDIVGELEGVSEALNGAGSSSSSSS